MLRLKIEKLKADEKALRSRVLDEFEAVGVSELPGHNGYSVKKLVSAVYTIKPFLFFKRVKMADFLTCCTVSITKAGDFISRADVLSLCDKSERVSLKVNL